jgi:hypothetical protein
MNNKMILGKSMLLGPTHTVRLSRLIATRCIRPLNWSSQDSGWRLLGHVVGREGTARIYRRNLVDELQIGIMSVLPGRGQRLFEYSEGMQIKLQETKLVETGQRADI